MTIDASKGPKDASEPVLPLPSTAAAGPAGAVATATADGAQLAAGSGPKDQYITSGNLDQYFVSVPCKLRLVAIISFLRWKCQRDAAGKVRFQRPA